MRLMYDAVTARNIPRSATMVAGYADTIQIPQWTDADWNLFPYATKVRIVKKASTNDGHVLDVEPGDATPAQAPGWATMRRNAGADPTVYCNESTWPTVRAAFTLAGVAQPHYWIAHYDGDPAIPAGAIAKQYQNTAGYDLSSVSDFWPGVDEEMPFTPDDFRALMWGNVFDTQGNKNFAGYLKDQFAKQSAQMTAILAAVEAGTHDPDITLDQMRTIVNDAVEQHVKITGTLEIGPATP